MKRIEISLDADTLRRPLDRLEQTLQPVRKQLEDAKWRKHLQTINLHRRLVRQYCFRVGLYRQGVLHDLSKYSPSEFPVGAKYFQGFQSPNNAERKDRGYSSAWLHHKGRNKHHLEYWIDYSLGEESPLTGMKMPVPYVVEMFCDRVAASRVYRGEQYQCSDPWEYYQRSASQYLMHPDTRRLLEKMLRMLADLGEERTLDYIRTVVLR